VYSSLITLNLPDWLNRSPRQEPPRPNVVAALRAEFQQALTSQKAELDTALATQRAGLQAEIAIARAAHEHTRAELAESRDYGRKQARTIDLLDSTVRGLQTTLENNTAQMIAMTTALAVSDERNAELRQEYQQNQLVNTAARQKLHERVAQLETIDDRLTTENATNANRAQVAEAKATWLVEENAMLRAATDAETLAKIDADMIERGRRVNAQ